MAVFQTYQAIGNREELLDVITNISPIDTPMFSGFKKVQVNSTKVEWQTDALAAAAANKKVEGADYSFGVLTPTTRVFNYTQILNKSFYVSGTEDAMNPAGRSDEYSYQMEKAMKELSRDIEYAIVLGAKAVGDSGTAREMGGVLEWISTNVETGSGTGTEALSESMFNDALQTISAAGGNPDTVYANGFQKRAISAFTANSTRNIEAQGGKLANRVDVYESDFGILEVVYDRAMSTDVIAILEKDKWGLGMLRGVSKKEVPSVGDARKGVIETEATVIAYNEASSGKITGLTTS